MFPFWERFKQTLSKYIPAGSQIRKNKNFEDLAEHKTSILGQNLENFSGEYGR